MTPEEWELVQAAFRQATDMPPAEREGFLRRFADEHPSLADELHKLLAADSSAEHGLQDLIDESLRDFSANATDPWIGRELGPWKITRRIAAGGMGAVFVAERADRQFEQTVALKIMSAQLLAADAVARFRSERQILAALNHPYIAKLHDGGTTDDGLPYLVMEFVDGLPIDKYCTEHQVDIAARLQLFRKVCSAVDYAHRNLTVHRDLKPSNILVDSHGNPKLLDFGIAKLLDPGAANVTQAMTREGARAMTPEYASPEQVRGEPVSVATDVYSLGVLLYRLLTGASPYGSEVSSPLEYERAIIGQEPRRPSTSISQSEPGAQSGESLRAARSRLAGDLDTIILTALQKEAERRYPSVSDFDADIGRHLRHQPIVARGDDWQYVAQKFLRRNRRGVALLAAAVAGVAVLVTFHTTRLAVERDRANLAAAESREVAEFLTDMFASASPHVAQGETVTAIDLLEQGRANIDSLAGQPVLQAELYRIIGQSYTALGYTAESIPVLERVLALKESQDPPDTLAIAEAIYSLAEAQRQHGSITEAEALMRRSLAMLTTELGKQDERVVRTQARLAIILFDQRRGDDGFALLQDALETKMALGSGDDLLAIDIRGNLANALDNQGRYAEALALHDETIALSRRVEGELAPNTIIRMSNRGLVLHRLGRYEEAIAQFEDAIERGEKVWPETADQMAFMIAARGGGLKRVGRYDEALEDYRKAADLTRRGIGEDNTRYVARLRGLGSALVEMGRFEEAEATFREALDLSIRLEGEDSFQAARIYLFLGRLMNDSGRFAEAEPLLQEAVKRVDRLAAGSEMIAKDEMARSLSGQGRFDEATAIFTDVLAEAEATNGPRSPQVLAFLVSTSRHFRRARDLERAYDYSARAFRIANRDEYRGHVASVLAVAEHGLVLIDLDRRDDAVPLLESARDSLAGFFGSGDHRVLELEEALNSR